MRLGETNHRTKYVPGDVREARVAMRERLRRKAARDAFAQAEWVELEDIGGGLIKRFEGGGAIMIRRQGTRWCATWHAPDYDGVCPLDALWPTMEAAKRDAEAQLAFMIAFMGVTVVKR